ncbi:Zinc finger NHR/GATA-type [Penicillium macrosclerotiorum]|uniref:Zinc finger NHR/GATA-type n=1 Tax=Penicillium macrosclerotiorum TaxID=303699 RepID=UPI00254774AF|nr:Zinc finger NHR/GATA-type [Penicillium macrosclerotiorum]KAJ5692687.1 Zinc finger NHR/GATA-type [Penicillium macrosclerotiorum]
MGSLETAPRHRDPLPSIGFLGKDGSGYTPHPPAAASPTSLLSPNNMYSGQPLPYSSYPPSQQGYISPPESRRVLEDEKEKTTGRQSLPSIHEALGNDNPLPYPAPTSAPPPQSGPPAPPTHLIGRSSAEGPPGPPNPFSNGPASGPLMRESGFPAHQNQLPAEASRTSLTSINTQESRNASLHSISTGKSPTQSAKTGITSVSGSQNSSAYDYSAPPSAGSVASPNGYSHFPHNYSFSTSQQPQSGPSYPPPGPYDNRAYMGAPRVEEVKGGFVGRPMPGQLHSDSVKRHLDVYDVETSLNEIAELSSRTLEFARHYAARAHQTQRSGPVLGSLPTLNEVEDMLHLQRRNQDALIRIRTAVVNQEQALAEQMAQRKAFKPEDEHMALYQEEFKGTGGFAGADSKKRRGKAAPPGRCHSCNRAETPEWRRGPDGARTLCNACGLHYAKLTRKMGANKAATLGSTLKPKTVLDSASPTSH